MITIPPKSKKPCNQFGCPNLTTERYCEQHKREERRYDRERGTAAERGYGSRWQKARLTFLKRNPLCKQCDEEGRVTTATVVDHRVPHKGDKELFWDKSNWDPLCKTHHDRKTAREDGGFGNAITKRS